MIVAGQSQRGRDSQSGFTLLEMLIVLTVIMIIMGLVLSGVFGSKKINKLVATEQMVGDMVRQARHAARSTGEPVVLVFRKDKREISGVSRVVIRTEAFDGGQQSWNIVGNGPGRTGSGQQVIAAVPRVDPWTTQLERREQLDRQSNGTNAGFYLACDVRPPVVDQGSSVVPLLIVTTDDPSFPNVGGDYPTSVCGIVLERAQRKLQEQPPAPPATSPMTPVYMYCWNVRGWVRFDGAPQPEFVSQLANYPDDLASDLPPEILHVPSSSELDVHGPLAGGYWEDVGLLFDGERLVLYRNGQRIGETVVGDSALAGACDWIYAGSVRDWDNPGNPPTDHLATDALIDNVRLYRLATDQAGTLPPGVTSKKDYRITAHPDGRVEVNAADEITDASVDEDELDEDHLLYFAGTQDTDDEEKATWAVISVSTAGRVISEIRTLDRPEEDADDLRRSP
ncbi:MAG: prepilin-type N-terminal cleavage/methylation domain-containing protein [Planctomycetes bacterium]|nr:prepilin-type N-terminal cleavage/methylation domain-containing protein [Planctomycetota bacterium]